MGEQEGHPAPEEVDNGISEDLEESLTIESESDTETDEEDDLENSEDFEALNNQIDALNMALDSIEMKNDDIYSKLVKLLEDNKQIREQMQGSQKQGPVKDDQAV